MIVRLRLSLLLAGILMLLACVATPLEASDRTPPHPGGLERKNSVDAFRRSQAQLRSRHAPTRSLIATRNHAQRQSTDMVKSRRHQFSPLSARGRRGADLLPAGKSSYDLFSRTFTNIAMLVPTRIAAGYIEDFFNNIALKIETGVYANQAPSNYHVFKMWDFNLSFYSQDTVIPLDFVQDYLLDTLAYVAKGFTGLYDEDMVGTINGAAVVVRVAFRVLNFEYPTFPAA
ncbi:MAG: hypothetical protein Q9211_001244 [Gyalolechia sp. 1 TL-2023]